MVKPLVSIKDGAFVDWQNVKCSRKLCSMVIIIITAKILVKMFKRGPSNLLSYPACTMTEYSSHMATLRCLGSFLFLVD